MIDKDKIIKIIENDNNYNSRGKYASDFVNDEMSFIDMYHYTTNLGRLLAFSGKEMTLMSGPFLTTVKIVASDDQQLLLKSVAIDSDGYTITEFWLINVPRLTGDVVWKYMD